MLARRTLLGGALATMLAPRAVRGQPVGRAVFQADRVIQ
jgi:hypothetical protein